MVEEYNLNSVQLSLYVFAWDSCLTVTVAVTVHATQIIAASWAVLIYCEVFCADPAALQTHLSSHVRID
jgi:hypothetical protein